MSSQAITLTCVIASVILAVASQLIPNSSENVAQDPLGPTGFGKKCFPMGGFENITLPYSQRDKMGYRNHGGCSCREAADELQAARTSLDGNGKQQVAVGGWSPSCDASTGDFTIMQFAPNGFSWCVDKNGNQVSDSVRTWITPLNCSDPRSPLH